MNKNTRQKKSQAKLSTSDTNKAVLTISVNKDRNMCQRVYRNIGENKAGNASITRHEPYNKNFAVNPKKHAIYKRT